MPRCVPCGRSFTTNAAWKQHVRDSPPSLHASTLCKSCKRHFVSEEALQKHLEDSPVHLHGQKNGQKRERAKLPGPGARIGDAETATFFTFPSMHQAILDESPELVPSPQFNNGTQAPVNTYGTHVMAQFTCNNHGDVPHKWSSKKVSIVIQRYYGNQYSAVVYNQGCENCKGLGKMALDERSYIERVAYRLKKWAGVNVEPPIYIKRKTPPHRADLCEGCKAGECDGGAGGFDDIY